MEKKYAGLVRHFLNEYADELSNNGCNDLATETFSGWSDDEKRDLILDFNTWAAVDGYLPVLKIDGILDFLLVRFLAFKAKV